MRRNRLQVLLAVLLVDLVAGATVISVSRAAEDADLPSSLHGAVETQALTAGNGALALFVDPGTAYAYSTLDRDDYGGGSISHTMTARGANLNLGTIALAVLWAAPDCNADGNYGCIASGGEGTPNTGLHEAGGFPLYAEALYPPPPAEDGASREYVYKCVVNKDAPGAAPTGGAAGEVCKSSDAVPVSAWAEAPGEEVRATGFSRAAGFASEVVSVGASESHSDVRYAGGGTLVSTGWSAISDISILGGQIRIESSRVAAAIASGVSGEPERAAECTFSGLTIGGNRVGVYDLHNPAVQAALDNIAETTSYDVDIIPPSPVVLEEGEAGKQVASCSGVKVFITDRNQGSPVPACAPPVDPTVPECVPALGNRIELTFGSISVQQSVNDLAPIDAGGGLGGVLEGISDSIDAAGSDAGRSSLGSGSLPSGGGGGAEAAFTPAPSGGSEAGAGSADYAIAGSQLASTSDGRNLGALGALTALSAVALMAGLAALVGVVNALGNGGRFKLPGL